MGLADIALGAGRASATDGRQAANIIEFIESPWGLDMKLFPVQKVILKTYYGLALDDTTPSVPLTSWRRDSVEWLTEAGYLRMLYDTGRCNVREVTPGVERQELVLSIGRRAGKCVVGDTLVLTDGGVRRIDELGDRDGDEFQPLVVGVVQEGGRRAQSAYFYNGGVQPTYRVRTYAGAVIEGTGKHRIKVMTPDGTIDWCRLDEIQVGSTVCTHRGSDLWAETSVDLRPHHVTSKRKSAAVQPEQLNEDWGLLLGYLVGCGTWTCRTGLTVTVENPETKEELLSLFERTVGKATYTPDKRTSRTGAVRASDRALREFLHNVGYRYDVQSHTKSTPWSVLRSSRSVVRSYLQGLFETDGSVSSDGQMVSFTSASRRLADETRLLLLNFGIVSCIRVKHNSKYDRDCYELFLVGRRSKAAFNSEIGFRSLKKNGPIKENLARTVEDGGDSESIPHQKQWVSRLLQSIPKSLPGCDGSMSTLLTVLGPTCKPLEPVDLTYDQLRSAIPIAQSLGADHEVISHFNNLLDTDYFFDDVVSVERGEAPVFDLNVPDGESFVANGMTNHNTTMSACIAAYETYRLINKGDPQAYYGLPASNTIQLISVATDKDQAGLLYNEVSGHFRKTAFFAPYTGKSNMSQAIFQSPKDIERYGSPTDPKNRKGSIKITFRSCVAKGLRGAGNIVIILDEVAHFTDDGQSSADAVYDAIVPSAAVFSPKNPLDKTESVGNVESKIICISSPLGKQGLFYKLFSGGFQSQTMARNRLCIQAPTWEVSPLVDASFFEGFYLKDQRTFDVEFGAAFSDQTLAWIADRRDLLDCVNPLARPIYRGLNRQPYYAGIDVGLVGDYTAIAIGHTDDKGRVVADLVTGIRAGEGDFVNDTRLEFQQVVDWIYQWTKDFYIIEGQFDQYLGIVLEQALQAKGLNQFRGVKSTPQSRSQMFQNFKDLMLDHKLVLYDWPKASGDDHCFYINEILELQSEYKSKYVTLVQAPPVQGKHDDHADALVRMVMLATAGMSKTGGMVGGGAYRDAGAGLSAAAMRRRLMQSGSSPDRQIAPGGRTMQSAGFSAMGSARGGGGISGVRGRPSALELSVVPPWRRGR